MLHTKTSVPHVDLAFEDLNHVEGKFYGLVGQFYGRGLVLSESGDGESAMMRIGFVFCFFAFGKIFFNKKI